MLLGGELSVLIGAGAWVAVGTLLTGDAMVVVGLLMQHRVLVRMDVPTRPAIARMAYISGGVLLPVVALAMVSWGASINEAETLASTVVGLFGGMGAFGAGAAAICIATATAIQSRLNRQDFDKRPVASAQIVPTWGRGPGLALVGTF